MKDTLALFDIETNGLLDASRVHCLAVRDEASGETRAFNDVDPRGPRSSGTIADGLKHLSTFARVAGHNIVGFDLIVLDRLYGWKPAGAVTDTLVISQLLYPNLIGRDFAALEDRSFAAKFPKRLAGKHSLEAWGARLGEHKGGYAEAMEAQGIDPWAAWSQDMQDYCVQDIAVTSSLIKHLRGAWSQLAPSLRSLEIEQEFRRLMVLQEVSGVAINEDKARELWGVLLKELRSAERKLEEKFPPRWLPGEPVFPKRTATYKDPSRPSVVKDVPYTPVSWWVFSPTKAEDIKLGLSLHGVHIKPDKYGKIHTDEDTLAGVDLPDPEIVPLILRASMLRKRIATLAVGSQAILKNLKDGRLHGRVNTLGTVTRRCSHSKPNMNLPKAEDSSPYGAELRELFVADKGFKFVGVDAAGIQLRALAHYLAPFDGGEYVRECVSGDIHSKNQKAWECATRNYSKTLTYSYLFGCLPGLTGNIIIEEARRLGNPIPKGTPWVVGERHRKAFEGALCLDGLNDALDKAIDKRGGWLKCLDGGLVLVRSKRVKLSALLQSAEAVIMKLAGIIFAAKMKTNGFEYNKDWKFALMVHDEYDMNVRDGLEEEAGRAMCASITEAGEALKFRCPLVAEFKVGSTWLDVH